MRRIILGIVAVVIVSLGWIGRGNGLAQVQAQQPRTPLATPAAVPVGSADDIIALGKDLADGRQQVAVIDAKTRVMCVYHIEPQTGKITLMSVRNLSGDLTMDEFNTDEPLPSGIRKMKTRR